MNIFGFLRYLTIEPVRLSFKEKSIVTLACFFAILLTGLITRLYAAEHVSILVASMGASAAILFTIPSSPLAQPWPFVGGQLGSAFVGVYCATFINDLPLAAASSAGLSVLLMLGLRCLHPPGVATALAPVLNSVHPSLPDVNFLLFPVGINVLLMLTLAYVINRLVLHREYPVRLSTSSHAKLQNKHQNHLVDITQADITLATRGFDHFLDISTDELLQIYTRLQLLALQKNVGVMRCGEIMKRDIITVEYTTEVETAWLLMHEHHLKAMPVLDKTRHVIGMVTRYDFLKNLKLTPYHSFQDKWLAFIRRSPGINTDKPEAIGHIMTRDVKILSVSDHVAELIPLIVNEGHHHLPIIDENNHFIGMVFQSQLILALFNHYTLAAKKDE